MQIRWGVLAAGAASGLVLVGALERRAVRRDRELHEPAGSLVDIGGRRLHLVHDEGPAPTVVIEAGGQAPAAVYRHLHDAIATFAAVCSYDRAGIGWSDPPPASRSFDAMADDLHDVLRAGRVPGPYVLVGESFGGLVVRCFAQRHRDEVAGVILVDAAEEVHAFSRLAQLRSQARAAQAASWAARLGIVRTLVRRSPTLDTLPVDVRQEVIANLSRSTHWRMAAVELDAYLASPPSRRGAGGFGDLGDLPLTVIRHGRPLTGRAASLESGWAEAQDRLVSLSSRGELIVAEEAGHQISLERADVVIGAVRAMVDTIRTACPPA